MLREYGNGLRDGIPIGLGYLSVSFAFGILAAANGLNWWEALVISMTNLTSAGQFAGLKIIVTAGSFLEMAITQFVINIRYSLMSVSLSQKVDETVSGGNRWLLGFFNTDEIFAVAMSRPGRIGKKYLSGLIITPYIGWSLGTLLGAVLGNILPDVLCNALGFAIYGMFIAILVPNMKRNRGICIVTVIAVVMSMVITYCPGIHRISSGFTVIICAVTASLAGAWLFPINEKD